MDDAGEIQIFLGDAKRSQAAREKPSPAEECTTFVASYGDAGAPAMPVFITLDALKAIERHAVAGGGSEVGGMLIGGIYRSHGVTYVRIDASLEAREATEKRSELTFTHDTWQQLSQERERKYPDLSIVGWYHSHPDLGVFLSDRDLFIHKNFFTDLGHVAFVVDPAANDRAFFERSGDKIVKCGGYYVFGESHRSSEINAAVAAMAQVRQPQAARTMASERPTVVKVIFQEPAINFYYLLPRFLRRMLGINNSETAPRLGVKSILIMMLAAGLVVQHVQYRVALRPEVVQSQVHYKFAKSFYDAGDYEEAGREYRRCQALEPKGIDSYVGQLQCMMASTRLPYLYPNLQESVSRLLSEATAADKKMGEEFRKRMLKMAGDQEKAGNPYNAETLRSAAAKPK